MRAVRRLVRRWGAGDLLGQSRPGQPLPPPPPWPTCSFPNCTYSLAKALRGELRQAAADAHRSGRLAYISPASPPPPEQTLGPARVAGTP